MNSSQLDKDSFYERLFLEIQNNRNNEYSDNYDIYRFGKQTLKYSLKKIIKKVLGKFLYRYRMHYPLNFTLNFVKINRLYNLLADENSKSLLVSIVSYHVLGYERYKLPLAKDFWQKISELENSLTHTQDKIEIKFINKRKLYFYKYDLNTIGYPVKLYTTPVGVYYNCIVDQYKYIHQDTEIKVEKGDIVLDCGACWGDTAILFAASGAYVHSFEFIPSNIESFKKNIELNPHLAQKINLISHPLGEFSDQELFYNDNGPASNVSTKNFVGSNSVRSISIDDYVEQNQLEKVDFIKMDIEGAELSALRGALNVIKSFKPKLAISIYHSSNDFTDIALFLDSLNIEYQFYLNHGTIHLEETVLMAQIKSELI